MKLHLHKLFLRGEWLANQVVNDQLPRILWIIKYHLIKIWYITKAGSISSYYTYIAHIYITDNATERDYDTGLDMVDTKLLWTYDATIFYRLD